MPYKGTLAHGTPVTVEVIAGTSNAGSTALTVTKVVRQDRFTEVDANSAAPGASVSMSYPINSAAQRLIIMVHPPVGGTALVKVTQGATTRFEDPVQGDIEFVYDLVP